MSKFSTDEVKKASVWQLPEVTGEIANTGEAEEDLQPQTVDQIRRVQKQAWDEGYEAGRKEGHRSGHDELREKARQLMGIITLMHKPLEKLDNDVVEQLSGLAVKMACCLVKREFRHDIKLIQDVIREALEQLSTNARNIRVHINPDDIELLREAGVDPDSVEWQWCSGDKQVLQGGCIVESEYSHIDASLDARLQQLMDQLYPPDQSNGDE